MTSASELFYNRRSRVARVEHGPGLDSLTPERTFHNRRHHHDNNSNHRHDLDSCDPLRRSPHGRHLSHRPSHSERALVRPDQGSSQFVPSNTIDSTISRITGRSSVNGNDRLPGAVLLARARLLERLRGVSLSENRRSSRASSGNRRRNLFDGEFRFDDAGDWGAESSTRQLTAVVSPFTDLITETGRVQFVHEAEKEKPPGLTQEALDCLQREIFSSFRIGEEEEVSKVSFDCGICLESFTDGDELICLPCDHRFHSACLYPWVRSCGDCPYCRRDIVVNSPIGTRKT
ncbi:probable E3 ubiquitin-protein ligase RHY1A [Mangifera indica]|uniref:probable E3 ubiquitin-protein ligase RHY1A n=1 Tax=Mangifera indica TaxID=29780 RepID=UPI001CFA0016|nr:probable E3 ubiquitin-protein ligase RHY1A [Mangifera indica]